MVVVTDQIAGRAAALAKITARRLPPIGRRWRMPAPMSTSWSSRRSHDWLSPIAVACLDSGKHVLVEKPAGRSLAEVRAIAEAAARNGRHVKVGYNHRFHPAIQKARRYSTPAKSAP